MPARSMKWRFSWPRELWGALAKRRLAVRARQSSCATGINGRQSDNGCSQAGAVYVFALDGGVWSQTAYVKASNTEANDSFGVSVGVSGTVLAVGASGEARVGRGE